MLNQLKRYPGNPWDRLSDELNNSDDSMARYKAARRRPTSDEMDQYFEIMVSQAHLKQEVAAFDAAWQGSIKHLPGTAALAKLPYEKYRKLFKSLIAQMHLSEA